MLGAILLILATNLSPVVIAACRRRVGPAVVAFVIVVIADALMLLFWPLAVLLWIIALLVGRLAGASKTVVVIMRNS